MKIGGNLSIAVKFLINDIELSNFFILSIFQAVFHKKEKGLTH